MKVPFGRLIKMQFRKKSRFKVKGGVFISFESFFSKIQVGDISMGGLCFYYEDKGVKLGKGSRVIKVITGNGHVVDHIPFTTISDLEAGELVFKRKRIKRQGLKFGRLTMRQKSMIRDIIRTCKDQPIPEEYRLTVVRSTYPEN